MAENNEKFNQEGSMNMERWEELSRKLENSAKLEEVGEKYTDAWLQPPDRSLIDAVLSQANPDELSVIAQEVNSTTEELVIWNNWKPD